MTAAEAIRAVRNCRQPCDGDRRCIGRQIGLIIHRGNRGFQDIAFDLFILCGGFNHHFAIRQHLIIGARLNQRQSRSNFRRVDQAPPCLLVHRLLDFLKRGGQGIL